MIINQQRIGHQSLTQLNQLWIDLPRILLAALDFRQLVFQEGTWVWTRSGKIVDMNSQAWGPGLPDQYNGLNEDCLHLMADLGFQWNDISCELKDMEQNGNHKPMKPLCQKRL